MRARVTVPHQGRQRGAVVEVDPTDAKEQGRLANEWLVSLDPPPPPEPPSKPAKRPRKPRASTKASKGQSGA